MVHWGCKYAFVSAGDCERSELARLQACSSGAEQSCALTGVQRYASGSSFALRIRACSAAGASPWTPVATFTPPPPAPPAPKPPALSAPTGCALQVTWHAPKGTAVSGFTVQFRALHSVAPAPASKGSETEGLPHIDGSELHVVSDSCGFSHQCLSADSSPRRHVPSLPGSPVASQGTPGAPDDFGTGARHACQENEISACCVSCRTALPARGAAPSRAPRSTGGADTSHLEALVENSDAAWASVDAASTATATTLEDLQPHTLYAVRVAAHAAGAQSPFSAASFLATTDSAPDAAPQPRVTTTSHDTISLEWAWQPAEQAHDDSVTHVVEFCCLGSQSKLPQKLPSGAWERAYTGAACTCIVSNLRPGCGYAFRLRGARGVACGAWSAPAYGSTALAPPLPPPGISCTFRGPTSLRVAWHAPPCGDKVGHVAAESYLCASHHLARTLCQVA